MSWNYIDLMKALLTLHHITNLEPIVKALNESHHNFLPGEAKCEFCNIELEKLMRRSNDATTVVFDNAVCSGWIIKGIIE